MASGYQEEDRRPGEQQQGNPTAAAATALPRPPVQPSAPTPRGGLLAGANSLLFSAFNGGGNQPASPASPALAPVSELTPLVGGPRSQWRPAAGEEVTVTSPAGTAEERRARSPLSSVMLILGVLLLVSCGAIIATLAPRSGPSRATELQLESAGPEEEEGAALAREGVSWKLPSLRWGTSAPTPVPTAAPTGAPTAAPTLAPTAAPTIPALKENLALGVCWAPRAEMKDPEEIMGDALLIRRHFRQVRTFYSSFYQTPVMPYFVRAGLRVALGVFLYKDQPEWSEAEKKVAIESYHQHPEHTIAIYVGNEDLVPFGTYTVDDLIGHMDDIRKAGVKAPVGTVQRMTEWVMDDPNMDRLAEACDVIGVNVYPYFSADNEDLPTQWAKMLKRYPQHAHKIRLTETGWPSDGSPNFAGQTATHGQGEWYYNYYLKWACEQASQGSPATETFYYAYFDGRAPPKAPDYEQWFGIVEPDGTPKYALADGFCPSETLLKEEAARQEREAAAAPEQAAQAQEGPVAAAEAAPVEDKAEEIAK